MRVVSFLLFSCSWCSLVVAQPPKGPAWLRPGLAQITEKRCREAVTFLASDEMLGRDTDSPALAEAGQWIANEFEAAGLKPLFKDGYLEGQRIGDFALTSGVLTFPGGSVKLSKTHVPGPCRVARVIEKAPVVAWVGAWKPWDRARTRLFVGNVVAFVAEGLTRQELRSRLGGVYRARPRAVVIFDSKGLLAARGQPTPAPTVVIREAAAAKALPAKSGAWEGASLSISIPPSQRAPSRNVGAILRGSDPKLANEAIIFSAHYDHVGLGRPVGDDRIYNGADDNATGTTAVLSMARGFAALQKPPRRTTIFLCFYGEERGFLGSRYYCENPAWPLENTRAVFNIEMVGRPDDIKPNEAWITGWRVSSFGPIVAASAEAVGTRFYEHKRNSRMLFTASDNIEFARRGVVAHSISAGSLHSDYHKPSDEVEKIDFANMTRVVKGIFVAGADMANGGDVPKWKAGTSYARRAAELRKKGGK